MKYIPNAVALKVGRQILLAQKHSPTILFAGGVVGVITTTVLACKATLHLEEVIEEAELKTNRIEDDNKKELAAVYVQTAGQLVKLYGPAIIVGSLSIGALAGSHNILSKRNAGLTAAYAALEKGFADYRRRVVEELGEEKDKEFRYSSEVETVKDEETGKTKKVKRVGPDGHSIYARFFQEGNQNWNTTPEYNFLFLRAQQNIANDILHSRGHIFLNEVYDSLGLERTKAGQVVGWVRGNKDDFVDFGIFEGGSFDRVHDFVTGREGCILLDFNVDGNVLELI